MGQAAQAELPEPAATRPAPHHRQSAARPAEGEYAPAGQRKQLVEPAKFWKLPAELWWVWGCGG